MRIFFLLLSDVSHPNEWIQYGCKSNSKTINQRRLLSLRVTLVEWILDTQQNALGKQRKLIKDANIVLIQFFTGNVTLMNSPAAVARLM